MVEILIGVILLGVIIKLLPFLLKVLLWVLVITLVLVVIFKVGWGDVLGWAEGITFWSF